MITEIVERAARKNLQPDLYLQLLFNMEDNREADAKLKADIISGLCAEVEDLKRKLSPPISTEQEPATW